MHGPDPCLKQLQLNVRFQLQGFSDCLCTVDHAEFAAQAGPVSSDGRNGQTQITADFLIRVALDGEAQDPAFRR